jgi:hypothetical protein
LPNTSEKILSFHQTDSSPSWSHKSDSLPNFGVNRLHPWNLKSRSTKTCSNIIIVLFIMLSWITEIIIYSVKIENNWKCFSCKSGPPYPSCRTHLSYNGEKDKVEDSYKPQFGGWFCQKLILFTFVQGSPKFASRIKK